MRRKSRKIKDSTRIIKPLFAIMSPRDIPWFKEKMDKIDYVDKVWFKYTPTDITLQRITKYFKDHPEYTHLILHCDDGAPDYKHVAMLIADEKKYDFDVITGCCCMDKMTEDMFLNVTFNKVMQDLSDKLRRESYELLPNEFRELDGIIRVWFEGNALAMMKRKVVENIGLRTWIHRFGADIRFSFECAKHGVKKYTDLRVYMEHYKYPQSVPPYNIKIDASKAETIEEKATAPVPHAKPAKMVEEIPEHLQKLFDFYYGEPRKLKVCIVTEFEQNNFFQWYEAIRHYVSQPKRFGNALIVSDKPNHIIDLSIVKMNTSTRRLYDNNHPYWNPIRNADLVFVYCARQEVKDVDGNPWEWYMLPVYVKEIMDEHTKMIVQFDDEFVFLWKPDHVFWKAPTLINESPEAFFKRTKILDVADAYFTVMDVNNCSPPWKKFTDKPVYYMPLPQLFRYKVDRRVYTKRNENRKSIVTLRHSVNSASVDHLVENLFSKLDIPITLFMTKVLDIADKDKLLKTLPPRSEVFSRLNRSAYMQVLNKSYIAIDDNEGYDGWSRFVLECSLVGIPVIGSTMAVKEIFPDLYIKHKNYRAIKKLIKRLCEDEDFYRYNRYYGYIHTAYALGDFNLVTKLFKIALVDLGCEAKQITEVQRLRIELIDLLKVMKGKRCTIPRRPNIGEEPYDRFQRAIINQKDWDRAYGKFRKILEDPEAMIEIKKEIK